MSDDPRSPTASPESEEGTSRHRAGSAQVTPTALAGALALGDVLVLLAAAALFSSLRNGWPGLIWLDSWHVWVTLVTTLSIGYVAGLYQCERSQGGGDILIKVLGAAAARAIALAVVVYLTAGWADNLGPLGRIALSQALSFYALWELITRLGLMRWLAQRADQQRWLVLASPGGPSAPALARLRHLPGFAQMTLLTPQGADGDAAWDEVGRFLGRPWSGIILAHDQPLPPTVVEPLMRARLGGARVQDLTDLIETLSGRVPLERVHHHWFLTSDGFAIAHSRQGQRIKRLVDLAVSGLMLVLSCWLMLLAALLVGCTSRGGILYRQVRVGRRGRRFVIYKFRTMRRDAEAGGVQWAARVDPRITAVGRVLRATRIDELPQLWNILRGDMSFIGPRPERPEFISTLQEAIPFYALRHLVKPGLTGWAQVCFPYGASIAESRQKLEYDLYYIKNHSLALDALILLRTVRVVVHRQGAR